MDELGGEKSTQESDGRGRSSFVIVVNNRKLKWRKMCKEFNMVLRIHRGLICF